MVASAVTDSDGAYTLDLAQGTYVVCEVLKTEPAPFEWQQSTPSGNTACTALGRGPRPGRPYRNPLQCPGHGQLRQLPRRRARVRSERRPVGNHRRGGQAVGHGDTAEECSSPAQAYPFDVGSQPRRGVQAVRRLRRGPRRVRRCSPRRSTGSLMGPELLAGREPRNPANPGCPPTRWRAGVVGVRCEAGQPDAAVPDCRRVGGRHCERSPAPIPTSTSRSTKARSGSSWVTPPGASGKQSTDLPPPAGRGNDRR